MERNRENNCTENLVRYLAQVYLPPRVQSVSMHLIHPLVQGRDCKFGESKKKCEVGKTIENNLCVRTTNLIITIWKLFLLCDAQGNGVLLC